METLWTRDTVAVIFRYIGVGRASRARAYYVLLKYVSFRLSLSLFASGVPPRLGGGGVDVALGPLRRGRRERGGGAHGDRGRGECRGGHALRDVPRVSPRVRLREEDTPLRRSSNRVLEGDEGGASEAALATRADAPPERQGSDPEPDPAHRGLHGHHHRETRAERSEGSPSKAAFEKRSKWCVAKGSGFCSPEVVCRTRVERSFKKKSTFTKSTY